LTDGVVYVMGNGHASYQELNPIRKKLVSFRSHCCDASRDCRMSFWRDSCWCKFVLAAFVRSGRLEPD